ncbi:hypothetical protein M422DRAFT_257105 [Sphaerobolus stellatus SS14]|uniref:Uncharacterized protein n=1 Tax=Sphaerobolus stellatus (strain SS14) TaxID=990650 RepID=A0A0C9VF59_SPHS4|nr:hypothetical protein M422DRAFT_257105 [Sphaerobolus stellatus SS14]
MSRVIVDLKLPSFDFNLDSTSMSSAAACRCFFELKLQFFDTSRYFGTFFPSLSLQTSSVSRHLNLTAVSNDLFLPYALFSHPLSLLLCFEALRFLLLLCFYLLFCSGLSWMSCEDFYLRSQWTPVETSRILQSLYYKARFVHPPELKTFGMTLTSTPKEVVTTNWVTATGIVSNTETGSVPMPAPQGVLEVTLWFFNALSFP